MMMVGCEKQADNETGTTKIKSFDLEIQGFNGASDAKTHWYNDVFWWDDGDNVVINGYVFKVVEKVGGGWKATIDETETQGFGSIDNFYYLAYPYDGSSARFNRESKTYGPIIFDGSVVPLAAITDSNKMTLTPCCAVLKGVSGNVYFYNGDPNAGGEPGCVDGHVLKKGMINISSKTLQADLDVHPEYELDYENEQLSNNNGYIIVPMLGESVTAWLYFEDEDLWTSHEVTLEKGRIYVIN